MTTDKIKYTHKEIYEQHHNTKIPRGYVEHHIDGNKKNNEISNLEMMSNIEHHKLHHKGKISKYDEQQYLIHQHVDRKVLEKLGPPTGYIRIKDAITGQEDEGYLSELAAKHNFNSNQFLAYGVDLTKHKHCWFLVKKMEDPWIISHQEAFLASKQHEDEQIELNILKQIEEDISKQMSSVLKQNHPHTYNWLLRHLVASKRKKMD